LAGKRLFTIKNPAKMVAKIRMRPSGHCPPKQSPPVIFGGDELRGGVSRHPLGGLKTIKGGVRKK
jgi:hypothetical protein